MRRTLVLLAAVLGTLAIVAPASASAAESGTVAVSSKVTGFAVQNGRLVADGVLRSSLTIGGQTVRDSSPVRFRVLAAQAGRRCNVLRLRLAPIELSLLGVFVETSTITLDIYARRSGGLLGQLLCGLTRNARLGTARVAASLNRAIASRPLRAFRQSQTVHTATRQGECEVLNLVIGPLRLDLLGLHVELFGARRSQPVTVRISAQPGHGLLGDLLCGVAGGPLPVPVR